MMFDCGLVQGSPGVGLHWCGETPFEAAASKDTTLPSNFCSRDTTLPAGTRDELCPTNEETRLQQHAPEAAAVSSMASADCGARARVLSGQLTGDASAESFYRGTSLIRNSAPLGPTRARRAVRTLSGKDA